jgi:hypothetical protein
MSPAGQVAQPSTRGAQQALIDSERATWSALGRPRRSPGLTGNGSGLMYGARTSAEELLEGNRI